MADETGQPPHPFGKVTTFLKEEIHFNRALGHGSYSMVYVGWIRSDPSSLPLSIKVPRAVTEDDVRAELHCMMDLSHVNVIRLMGIAEGKIAVSESESELRLPWMLLEYAEKGDMLKFIKERKKLNLNLDYNLWTRLSLGVAKGMAYLHSRLLIHCDLHTKNCFITNHNLVKIGDFGLSYILHTVEDEAYILSRPFGKRGRPKYLPVKPITGLRWKAPEYIPGEKFPPIQLRPGDVWAFGILLYELWSEGMIPFEPLKENIEVGNAMIEGKTPLDYFPEFSAPAFIIEMIKKCLAYAPNQRPKFDAILETLRAVPFAPDDESIA